MIPLPALKKVIFILFIFVCLEEKIFSQSQAPVEDTIKPVSESSGVDSEDIDFDILFDEFASFLDSISKPHSYFLAGVSLSRSYYNSINKSSVFLETSQKITYSPAAAYFHKSGLGITATANLVNDGQNLNAYQLFLSPGFDYLKNKDLATGISYTKYFTKDSLPFYTTPLQNELYTYFTYRKWWIRPTVALSYGWGSRSDYMEREEYIADLRLRRTGIARINTTESVRDFSLITSVRHDFYWLDVLADDDYIRLTPQINFTSGTQKFGFNQSSNTYVTVLRTGANILYNSENTYLDDELRFQPLSLTFFLRSEYSIGKFYFQPQLVMDYYFPATEKNFSALISFNAGFIF